MKYTIYALMFLLLPLNGYAYSFSPVVTFSEWGDEQEADCPVQRVENGSSVTLTANANCGGNIWQSFDGSIGIMSTFNILNLTENAAIGFGKQVAVMDGYRIFVQMDVVRKSTSYFVRCFVQKRNEGSQTLKTLMYAEFEQIPTNSGIQMAFGRDGNRIVFYVAGQEGMFEWSSLSTLTHVDRGYYIYAFASGDEEQASATLTTTQIIYQ